MKIRANWELRANLAPFIASKRTDMAGPHGSPERCGLAAMRRDFRTALSTHEVENSLVRFSMKGTLAWFNNMFESCQSHSTFCSDLRHSSGSTTSGEKNP